MRKRQFLGTAAAALGLASGIAQGAPNTGRGPFLLTVTGAVGKQNRGPFDPMADLMMAKQKLHFERAYGFDWASLAALPLREIAPTLEYDAKVHRLRGPALADVLQVAGVKLGQRSSLVLRAVDGYAVTLGLAQARQFIVATHLDGAPMSLGGLGPLWALHDADRIPELAAKPLAERYAGCPWALYHIDVLA